MIYFFNRKYIIFLNVICNKSVKNTLVKFQNVYNVIKINICYLSINFKVVFKTNNNILDKKQKKNKLTRNFDLKSNTEKK